MKEYRQEEFKKVNDEIHKINDFAECYEIKGRDLTENDNMLRFYKSSPSGYTLQIRTHKGIGQYGNSGKPRHMIANITVGRKDIEAILEYMTEKEKQ